MKLATIGIAITCAFLTGCEHNFLLVKAGHVRVGDNATVRCVVVTDANISPELRHKADDLCASVHSEYGNTPQPRK